MCISLYNTGMDGKQDMNLQEWLDYGIAQGYAEGFCIMHDQPPMNDSEADAYYSELDPCIPALRVWLY